MHLRYLVILLLSIMTANGSAQNVPIQAGFVPVVTNIDGTVTNSVTHPANYPLPDGPIFNFSRTLIPYYPITDASLLTESTSPANVKMTTSYTDGWGRKIEDIIRYSNNNKDLVVPYDNRQMIYHLNYLPYTVSANSSFRSTPYTEQQSYYNALYPDEMMTAYSETFYDAANRRSATYAAGKSNVGQSNGQTMAFATNVVNEVIIWEIDPVNSRPIKRGYYQPGQLVKKIIETADGGQAFEYYDKNNKLICKNVLAELRDCADYPNTMHEAGHLTARRMYSPDDLTDYLANGDNNQQGASNFSAGQSQQNNPGNPANTGYGTETIASRKVLPTNYISLGCPTYLLTYYVYDDYDRLTYTLPPKAVEYLKINGWAVNDDIINNLTDFVIYDGYGRKVETHMAGQNGNELIVYDKHNRVALTKNLNEDKWIWNHYDKLNRVIQSGDLDGGAGGRVLLQSYFDVSFPTTMDNSNNLMYYLYRGSQQGKYISNTLYGPSICNINITNYYDNYSASSYFNGSSSIPFSFSYDASAFTGNTVTSLQAIAPPAINSNAVRGALTYSARRVLKPYPMPGLNDFITTASFYDENGRNIQRQEKNPHNGLNIYSTQYDFTGRILTTINKTNNPDCAADNYTSVITRYNYLPYSMLLGSVTQSINGEVARTIAHYTYDDLGRETSKTIGGIEYQKKDYNIRGQLTGINKRYVEENYTGGQAITFGESIKYDAGFTHNLFCGGITGILWKGVGDDNEPRAYGYTYDRAGRLIQSDYRHFHGYFTTTPEDGTEFNQSWNNMVTDYTEGDIKYDFNGNITQLTRYGPLTDASGTTNGMGVIDKLSYAYGTNDVDNKIDHVDDAADATATAGVLFDFKNRNTSGADYSYDANGNVTGDGNKKILSLLYYFNGKPKSKLFANGNKLDYVYDIAGNKVREVYTTASAAETTDYDGAISYKDNVLYKVDNSEGYSVKNTSIFDYFFYVRDHLGNVRNILRSQLSPVEFDYYASHEPAEAIRERLVFSNIDNVRDDKPLTLEALDIKAARLNAGEDKIIGTAIVLKVMGGDKVDISADAMYESDSSDIGNVDDSLLFGSLIASLTGNIKVSNQEASLPMLQKMFSQDDLKLLSTLSDANVNKSIPQSFINYIVYDENFNVIARQSGRIQIDKEANAWKTIGTEDPIHIRNNGYLTVFLSTTSTGVSTWFDHLSLHHYVGEVKQVNHYYPFGLTINNMAVTGLGTPLNPIDNKNLYQTKEYDTRENLYTYDFGARTYDPQLGRFTSLDPHNQTNSGYTGMCNRPSSIVDPSGMDGEGMASANIWGAMGISGSSSFPGFVMSSGEIEAGYKALQSELSFLTINAGLAVLTDGLLRVPEVPSTLQVGERLAYTYYETGEILPGAMERIAQDIEFMNPQFRNELMQKYPMNVTPEAWNTFNELRSGLVSPQEVVAKYTLGTPTGLDNLRASLKRPIEIPDYHVETYTKTAADLATAWQSNGAYPGVDAWRNITLKEGTFVAGGLPGPSNFYTTLSGLERSGLDRATLFQGLQVGPNIQFGYRSQVGIYAVPYDMSAAFGTTYANPMYGTGGLPQIFIPDYQNLTLLTTINLK